MDANNQTQYFDESSISPDVGGYTGVDDNLSNANPNEINLNPAVAKAEQAVSQDVNSLDELRKTIEDLRKGVNPILDENKSYKAKIEELEAKLNGKQDDAESTVSEDDATIASLGLATRDDVRADLEALKADMKLEKQIDELGVGEKRQELLDLMQLDSNKGLSPHEVAEKYSLADDYKINRARSRGMRGTPNVDGGVKDLRHTENVDWNNPAEVQMHIDLNSSNNSNFI